MIAIAIRLLPYIALIGAILFVELLVYDAGATSARQEVTAHYEAILRDYERATAEATAKALEDEKANAHAALEAEKKELQARAATEQQFKVITQTVTKYVEKNPDRAGCAVDPDFVRLWNNAQRGAAEGSDLHR